MNDLKMRLLEFASANPELAKHMATIESCEELARFLNENGFETSVEELEAASSNGTDSELTSDELEAVVGGDNCICIFGGGGGSGEHENVHERTQTVKEDTCGCAFLGFASSEQSVFRCFCLIGGSGDRT